MHDATPGPRRFLTALASTLAGLGVGVLAITFVDVQVSEAAIEAGTYRPNMGPRIRYLFAPWMTFLLALCALPVDLLVRTVLGQQALPSHGHRFALGLAYSLVLLPLAFPRGTLGADAFLVSAALAIVAATLLRTASRRRG